MIDGAVAAFSISTHALHEEGDYIPIPATAIPSYFYPRPPRGGRRRRTGPVWRTGPFLPTPSTRRATHPPCRAARSTAYFYPRPPRGGRRGRSALGRAGNLHFYPRPPRGGRHRLVCHADGIIVFLSTPSARRATLGCLLVSVCFEFLSTPSARRATTWYIRANALSLISIHALREEGDALRLGAATESRYFYPRPPRGGRLDSPTRAGSFFAFLSTPSARRATPTRTRSRRSSVFLSTPSARRATQRVQPPV